MNAQINLRDLYEHSLGTTVADRTWRRVRHSLGIRYDYDAHLINVVIRAASKRRENATRQITRAEIAFELNVEKAFLDRDFYPVTGVELLEEVSRILGRQVSRQTMYRWGKSINCPWSAKGVYRKEHLALWAVKLFPHYSPPIQYEVA